MGFVPRCGAYSVLFSLEKNVEFDVNGDRILVISNSRLPGTFGH